MNVFSLSLGNHLGLQGRIGRVHLIAYWTQGTVLLSGSYRQKNDKAAVEGGDLHPSSHQAV